MEDELEAGEQLTNSKVPPQLQPHVYRKGQSGNPSGRPKGISLKEYVKLKFASMTDDEREDFLNGIDKKVLWEMAESKPKQDTDVTTNGKELNTPILVKFIDGETKS
jgi:hypothetical protein